MACSSSKLACIAFLAIVATVLVAPCAAQNFPQDFVNLHNAAREEVGVDPVTWNDTVAAWAQNYANSHQEDCKLMHSPSGRPYGENLFGGTGSSWSARDAVKSEEEHTDRLSSVVTVAQGAGPPFDDDGMQM
ncbi:hypothetical protein PR202_gb12175 [Eleusine coracana subsp. coracana]|uniref:SCP domain-containing protein n=1 Tax=Eleusine coracana subsp. coracana TaxID=191504 RepID=A0AAV5ENM9_ELECO|nr:hypothetical protein PR202_gb12175 [Eleusine coracana subsp. coracana]